MGTPYSDKDYNGRNEKMEKTDPGDKYLIMDSHMHLDKLELASHLHDLEMILEEGPMPATPVILNGAVINFCHGMVKEKDKELIDEDTRLFYTYGIHPKVAHTVIFSDEYDVIKMILTDKRCVGYGEFGPGLLRE